MFSVAANADGVRSKGAVHLQLRPHDPRSFSTFYGNAECPQHAIQLAAYVALQQVLSSMNVAFVDLHFLAQWKQRGMEAQREQQHQQALAQLQLYHETRRKRDIKELNQKHADHVYELEHDLNFEVEDLEELLEKERGKNKKQKLEVENLETKLKKQEDNIDGLLTENMNLREKLAGMAGQEITDENSHN